MLSLFVGQTQESEDRSLELGVSNAEASATQLGTVQDHVIGECAHPLGCSLEQLKVLRVWSCKRMIDRPQLAGLRAPLKQRKIENPDEPVDPCRNEPHPLRDFLSDPIQRRTGDAIGPG